MQKRLLCEVKDYLEVIKLTGRCIRKDKAEHIEGKQAQAIRLAQLKIYLEIISPENWLVLT